MTHVYYLSFYVLEAQKQLSWVVLAQGLSGGCSWEVGQGCNRPDQGLLSFQVACSQVLAGGDKWPRFLSQGWLTTSGHGSCFLTEWAGPRKARQRCHVFYDSASEVTRHHFGDVLMVTQVSPVQCGRDTRSVNPWEGKSLGTLEAGLNLSIPS